MPDPKLIMDGIALALSVANAIMAAIQSGGTKATAIAMAQGVLDRAKAVDHDVDDVAAGRA